MNKAEMETTICWDAAGKTAAIFSANPVDIRKLDKLTAQYPDIYRCTKVDNKHGNKFYEVPSRYIRYGKPASLKQLEASRNALSKGHKTVPAEQGVSIQVE